MTKVVRRGLHTYIRTYGYLLIIATIITVFAALTTIGVSAIEFDTAPYTYNGKNGVTIIGFNNLSDGEKVTIPAEIDGKPVLALGLEGIATTMPISGAEKIGALDLITQATNLKIILPYAFNWCSNIKGTIESKTVEIVERYAFYSCTELTSFNAENLTTVRRYAFYGCTGLTSFNAPKVTTVESYAFKDCKELTSLNLPALTTAERYTFKDCTELKDLNFPALTTVGRYAFYGCTGLTSFNAPKVTTVESYTFAGAGLASFSAENLTKVGNYAFEATKLKSLNAPKLTKVGNYAFKDCTELKDLNFPALTTVGTSAFAGAGLASFSAENLTKVGEYTFEATKLKSLNAPKLTKVGNYAFFRCYHLTSITLKEGCSIGQSAFSGVWDTCDITYVNDKGDVVKTVELSEM